MIVCATCNKFINSDPATGYVDTKYWLAGEKGAVIEYYCDGKCSLAAHEKRRHIEKDD